MTEDEARALSAIRDILAPARRNCQPIPSWHVGLIDDIERGKDVGIEAVAAIKNLERLPFRAEKAICETCDAALDGRATG